MDHDLVAPGWTGLPPFSQPFLHALNRMRARETVRPAQLEAHAECLLDAACGPGAAVRTASAHAAVGLIAEHARYVDGFALVLPLPRATGVAARPAAVSRVVSEAGVAERTAVLARGLVARLAPEPVEVAFATTIPAALEDASEAALAVALAAALRPGEAPADHLAAARAALEAETGVPANPADLAAALSERPGTVLLVDTRTYETRPLDAPSGIAWGVVATGAGASPARVRALARWAERARAAMAAAGFSPSPRDLDPSDLARALDAAGPKLRPTMEYLVHENRRAQRFAIALRRGDAQMMGALLSMSARARHARESLTPAERRALDALDARSLEGVLGATVSGLARQAVVLARPAALPGALEAARDALGAPDDAVLMA